MAALVDAGRLRVLVDEALPLEQAAQAHDLVEKARPLGKVVLTP